MKHSTALTWISGLTGVGLLIAAGVAHARMGSSVAGLGWGRGRRVYGQAKQAPIIDQKSVDGYTTTLREMDNMPIEVRVASIQQKVRESIQDGRMRKIALQATAHCPERDGLCEAKAVYDFIKQRVRYTGDVAPIRWADGKVEGVDLFQAAYRTLEFGGGDCLPLSSLVLRDDFQLVPLVELNPGDRIMADGRWTTVHDLWFTGEKALLEFDLSNGCTLRCTSEHRVFRDVAGRIEEIRASEVQIGDALITPESIPVGDNLTNSSQLANLSPEDSAWLIGAFIADGWADGKHTQTGWHPYRAAISGADGKPKEEQKRRVQRLMQQINIDTRWHAKYIMINDPSLARFFATMGSGAPNKRLPSMQLGTTSQVEALLEGLAADADRRNGVFGTTSSTLALQLRVLHRMLGRSVHIKRVTDHGGLGTNPIYRITPRAADADLRHRRFAVVRAIVDGGEESCMDLTTDLGKFWLPESDVIVHNCDDHNILASTMLAQNGITPRLRVVKTRGAADWEHIFTGALLPKGTGNKFIALDTTLPGNSHFGREPTYAKFVDFDA